MQLRLNRWQQPAELRTSHLWWIEKQVCRLPYGFKPSQVEVNQVPVQDSGIAAILSPAPTEILCPVQSCGQINVWSTTSCRGIAIIHRQHGRGASHHPMTHHFRLW